MTRLTINDLHDSKDLDNKAMTQVRGGYTAMANTLVTTMGPYSGLPLHQPALYPSTFMKKSLTNISEQLNIAVGSAYVSQGNSNSVIQY